MTSMTLNQIEEFLGAPRHAIVGTNPLDGPPQLSPVWYVYEEGRLYISVLAGSAKHRNLGRDPRISVCIDGCYPDYRTVIIYGTAELVETGQPLQEEMHWRIIRNYHETEEAARRYLEATREEQSVLLIVTPHKIVSQDFN
jgi:PPOX class probable F420-dependent enzyme